ncbi:MAG: peptide chain release factor N(5)-glutamine methyltransferase [Acidimicrobiales bacterium]
MGTDGAGRETLSLRALRDELVAQVGEDDTRWIMGAVLGVPPAAVPTKLLDPAPEPVVEAALRMAARRRAGEPVQYVLGSWAFRTLEVVVDPRVLIPRPETEQVVEAALGELERVAGATPGPVVAADLGTGSGVIALSLVAEGPATLEVWAVDSSPGALEVARANLDLLVAEHAEVTDRVRLVEGEWFDAVPPRLAGALQLVVSNPPYVSEAEFAALDAEVRDHEPRGALVAGPRGTEAIEQILRQALGWLAPGGAVVIEIAPHQSGAVATFAESCGYAEVGVRPDLAGLDRILVGRRP